MASGHPELVDDISREINDFGPITFARFMELALYHPQFGYYMRGPEDGSERIGWQGDYYTSSDVHSILGQALARQAEQIDRLLGQPDPFTLVEMGPGKGLLAKHILSACRIGSESFRRRLRYILIDRSPAMRKIQRHNLSQWLTEPDMMTWADQLDALASAGVTGMVFSNELLDAFPIHRIHMTSEGLQEVHVDYQDGQFVDCLKPLSTAALDTHLRELHHNWPEGYRTEVNLQALDWMKQVARCLNRGVVLTIDYGHTAHDFYRPERKTGTFLCYSKHSTNETPYQCVGAQDMTAHVDFSSLAAVGETHGLQITGFTNQLSFLMGLGVEAMMAELQPESPEFQSAIHLLKPNGMGGIFKVLVQHKGIEAPNLDGLKYKPFMESALTGLESKVGA
ncbi:MAG: SAM-dependent methyltransferase [Nitrospira sp.]|nr:SAM-dependent methyltransferase [Nitrospira sp.]